MTALNIADWIADLASTDAATRERASLGLYRYGKAMGEAATSAWRQLMDFSAGLAGSPVVGVAVKPENFDPIRVAFGGPRMADVPSDQDAAEFEVHVASPHGEAWLDILTTRAPGAGGAIDRYLAKFGEGIQQVEFPVRNVDRATSALRDRLNVQPIYAQTRAGANGTRVNFFLAATPDGKKVLVELVETP